MFGTFDVAGNKLNSWTRRFRKEGVGGWGVGAGRLSGEQHFSC